MIVLTDGKDASIAYCLTTALYCPLPGQYLAIARHETIRREEEFFRIAIRDLEYGLLPKPFCW